MGYAPGGDVFAEGPMPEGIGRQRVEQESGVENQQADDDVGAESLLKAAAQIAVEIKQRPEAGDNGRAEAEIHQQMRAPEQVFAEGYAVGTVPKFIPDAADENRDASANEQERQGLARAQRQAVDLRLTQLGRQGPNEQMPEHQREGADDQEKQAGLQPEDGGDVGLGRDAAPDCKGGEDDGAGCCGETPAEASGPVGRVWGHGALRGPGRRST